MNRRSTTVLVLTPEPPWPVANGWAGRHSQLIRSITEFAITDVVAIAEPRAEVDADEVRRQLAVRTFKIVRHSPPPRLLAAAASLITSRPMGSLLFDSLALRRALAELSRQIEYDIALILGDVCMAKYATGIRAGIHLLDMCDDLALNYVRRAATASSWVLRGYYRRQAKIIRRYLRRVSPLFERMIVIAQPDLASLARDVNSDVVTVPNGVDVQLFHPAPDESVAPHEPRMLFVGAMRSWPNRQAVQWFASEVLPHITRENRSAQLHVVGSGADQFAISSPGVIRQGFVEDLSVEYRSCDVFICPLLVGTGIKNKLLEALASGCAIVSTDVGIEGLGVRHGEHVLVANTPVEFAHAVNRLLRQPELRIRLGKAARSFAEKCLSLQAVRSHLRAAMLPMEC